MKGEGGKRQRREQGDCWFCLGGEHVRKHMVVSVGQHCYLALARGGVNSQHVLILPIQHHQSSLTIPDEVQFEVEEYKKALREMFKVRGLATFIYERNYKTDHMQIQVIPINKKYKERRIVHPLNRHRWVIGDSSAVSYPSISNTFLHRWKRWDKGELTETDIRSKSTLTNCRCLSTWGSLLMTHHRTDLTFLLSRSAVPGPRTPFFVCELEDGTR